MRLNKEVRKEYYNACRKQKFHDFFDGEYHETYAKQFYAQRRLIESMYKGQIEELDAIRDKAREKAHDDFNFYTSLG